MSVYFIFLVKPDESFMEIKCLLSIIPLKYAKIKRISLNTVGFKEITCTIALEKGSFFFFYLFH